jgi:translation initiation factor IF-3
VPQVRVIDEAGAQVGVMAVAEALKLAREQEYDLVEVAPLARPPVCRIMDYGRYKYELSKRQRKAKQKAHQSELKEIKMRPKIGDHDYQTKVRHAREFLEKHDKVKFSVRFRGREIVHQEFGRVLLERAILDLADVASVEASIRPEGYLLTMVLAPRPGK